MTASSVKIGMLATCIFLLLTLPTVWLARQGAHPPAQTNIAIEHTSPLTLRIARLAASGGNIVDLSHTSSGSIALHLPASWLREEVRGVALSAVTAEAQEWNTVRWVIPAYATVRFSAPNADHVLLHNPSGIPVTVRTIRIDAVRGERQEDATIVTTDPLRLP